MAAPRRAERLLDDNAQLRKRVCAPRRDGAGVYVMRGARRARHLRGQGGERAQPVALVVHGHRCAAAAHASAHRERLRLRGDRVPERARGARPRELAHQAAPAAIQRAPQGRQELSVPQDPASRRARRGRTRHRARGGAQAAGQERRGRDAVPAPVLHAQGDSRRRALLRSVHERAVTAHHRPIAAHHLSVPHLQRRDLPARARVPRLSHQALLRAVRGKDRRSGIRGDPRAGAGVHGGAVGQAARRAARPDGCGRRRPRLRAGGAFSRPAARDRAHQRAPDGAARRALRRGLHRRRRRGGARDGRGAQHPPGPGDGRWRRTSSRASPGSTRPRASAASCPSTTRT